MGEGARCFLLWDSRNIRISVLKLISSNQSSTAIHLSKTNFIWNSIELELKETISVRTFSTQNFGQVSLFQKLVFIPNFSVKLSKKFKETFLFKISKFTTFVWANLIVTSLLFFLKIDTFQLWFHAAETRGNLTEKKTFIFQI